MSADELRRQTAEVDDIEIKEWMSSLDYVLKHGSPEQAQKILQQLQIRAQEAGVTLPFTVNTPILIPSPRASSRPIRATVTLSARSKVSSAGTRWRWSSAATTPKPASAGIFPPTLLPRPCSRSGSIISSARAQTIFAAISFISRDTPLPAFTRGRSWKAV